MSFDIALPKIKGADLPEQFASLNSYVYQMVQQINWALNSIEGGSGVEIINEMSQSSGKEISRQDALAVFQAIKTLIINSADIVEAYDQQMTQIFESKYLAGSDFGSYAEYANNAVKLSSSGILQKFERFETITSQQINELFSTNAYIKTGYLGEEDNQAVYGVEIKQETQQGGQTIYNRWARFTSNGIAFYPENSDEPVAIIKNGELHITKAEVTDYLRFGNFSIDLTNGMKFKYIGGAQNG